MINYFFEKIIVSGPGKDDATVQFTDGLNIISGPSNTGKTSIVKAIDFLFGATKEKAPFSTEETGYDKVEMIVATRKYGRLSISRKFDENTILILKISDAGNKEPFGEFNARKGKKEISDFWCDLLDISVRPEIVKNDRYGRQRMGWRTLSPSLLITQDRVDTDSSVLYPKETTQFTAYLSILLFLLYGDDYSGDGEKESRDQRKLRQASVANYINASLSNLHEKYEEARASIPGTESLDVQTHLASLISELESVETEINQSLTESKSVVQKIYKLEQQQQEAELLLNRYSQLQTQYSSDVERLTLIVDGERLLNDHNAHAPSHNCPFCNGELGETEQTIYVEAARAELQNLASQMADLNEAIQEAEEESNALTSQLHMLDTRKEKFESLISSELKPKALNLKEKIEELEGFIRLKNKLESLLEMQASLRNDLAAIENEPEDATPAYKPKERFESDFFSKMSDLLDGMLRNMSYKPTEYRNAYFAKKEFDIKVNGSPKSQGNGQGYTSFLNSVVVMAYRHILSEQAKYKPGVFIIDTPLLGLDERVKEIGQDSMKESLFRYFVDHQDEGQLIIIENTTNLPKINFKELGVHQIIFTEDKEHGRYGFLPGVYN